MSDDRFPRSVCRLIVDPPADGAWNMAIDEALLNAVAETEIPTLRFYQWQKPTLSLGYFQNYSDRSIHAPSLEANVVRRLSGGGAILHDQELTYCLVLPISHPLARDSQSLYRAVHEVIIQNLGRSISTAKSPWQLASCEEPVSVAPESEPFLCFQRRSPGDVLLRPAEGTGESVDHKIVGSAQRRRRGVVIQHGSLLLSQSQLAPELLGLNDVLGTNLHPEDILDSLAAELGNHLGLNLQPFSSAEYRQESQDLIKNRYASSRWSRRR